MSCYLSLSVAVHKCLIMPSFILFNRDNNESSSHDANTYSKSIQLLLVLSFATKY